MYASTLNPPHKGGHRGIVAMLATTEGLSSQRRHEEFRAKRGSSLKFLKGSSACHPYTSIGCVGWLALSCS